MRRNWIIALLLAAGTLALYWPVRQFDLIYFDDPLLLKSCPAVQAGLTWGSVKWAFTSVVIANWQPVTNLSFLAVSQFFGIAPARITWRTPRFTPPMPRCCSCCCGD
jgi:hypothetical protein